MDIDMAALRLLEREREIPMDVIVEAIEQALLSAYQRLEGHARHARVELDRTSGHVTVWAREEPQVLEDGTSFSVRCEGGGGGRGGGGCGGLGEGAPRRAGCCEGV